MKKLWLLASLALASVALGIALPSTAHAAIVQWGQQGDVPINADFDGDGRSDITVWRKTTGEWWTIPSSTGVGFLKATWGGIGDVGDIPVAADYDGDGKADVAIFRPSTHQWWIALSSGGVTVPMWGDPGDIPVPADYDGDGKDDIAIWRPSTGTWWLAQSTKGVRTQQWGQSGDIPIGAQVDSYMGADFVVLRPSTRQLFTLSSSFGGSSTRLVPSFTETPVAAPFYCYADTIGTFNTSTGRWTVPGQDTLWFGMAGDIPLPGLYRGSNLGMSAQRAVFRPSTGRWIIHDVQSYCVN